MVGSGVVGRRLRIGYFVPPSRHFAGIERVVHELATGLALDWAEEFEVHVIFASRYDEAVLAEPAYTLHVLGVDRLRGLVAATRRVVAAERFDVFVCPQVEASVITWVATRGLGLRAFVSHLHGNPRLEEADGTRRTRLAFAFFRRVLASRVAGTLAVSPSLARYAATSLVRGTPVRFARNPLRDLAPAPPPAPSGGSFRFVSVGRLSVQKGQDVLLRALALARPALPPVRLTLVGSGPEEGRLRALCTQLGLDDLVEFTGYATDPAPYFAAADCFVLASRWEGFGMVLVEALHFGLPLLATDCEFGPADIITGPEIGRLVPADDPVELAAGLRAAAAAGPDRDHGARSARQRAAHRHDRSPVAAEHREVLRELLSVPSAVGSR